MTAVLHDIPDTASTDPTPPTPEPAATHASVALAMADPGGYDGPNTLEGMKELADWLAGADGAIPDIYVGEPKKIGAAMMQARRLDISVMAAMSEIYYDGGKPSFSAGLILFLVLRAGHRIKYLRTSDTICVMEVERGDGRAGGTVEWSIDEADRAGLLGHGDEWDRYPKDSLRARCTARLARWYCPDATGGVRVYLREERRSGYADGPGGGDAAIVETEVSPEAAALIDGVDELAHKDVRKRWEAAKAADRLNAYVGRTPGGVAMTAGQVLMVALERTMPPPKVRLVTSTSGLDCGCSTDYIVMNGDHEPGCDKRVAPIEIVEREMAEHATTRVEPFRPRRRRPSRTRRGKGGGFIDTAGVQS